jgi:hypothetical protein
MDMKGSDRMTPQKLTDNEQKFMELLADEAADRAVAKADIPSIIGTALALHQATCQTGIDFRQSRDRVNGALWIVGALAGLAGVSGIVQFGIWLVPKL